MARGRKKNNGQGRVPGRHGDSDRGQRPGNRSDAYKTHSNVHDKGDTANMVTFSLRDEALNTERHHTWNSDRKLRHTQVNFVSAGCAEPDASEVLQESTLQVSNKAMSHTSPPQKPLAGIKISEQDVMLPGVPPPGQRLGAITSGIGPMQRTPERDQHRRRSVDSMYFLDDVGSPVAIKMGLAPPKVPRPISPSPSVSSEEVIVFEGRKGVLQKSLEPQVDTAVNPSTNINGPHMSPRTNGKLNSASVCTVDSSPAGSATLSLSQQPVYSNEKDLDSEQPTLVFRDTLRDVSSKSITLSHRGKRRQHGSEQIILQPAKEDEMLADYIEHMEHYEVLEIDAALRIIAGDEDVLIESSRATKSRNNKTGGAKERNTRLSSASGPNKDLNAARAADKDVVLCAFTDTDSNESIEDAELAADLLDDMEDERDLLERKQARMTDEHIARLLAKQEELGLSSNELLLFDGDEDQSSEEDDDDVLFQSAATKRRRKGKRGQQQQSPSAMALADMFEQDRYGHFDVMDHDRPSLKSVPRSRRNAPAFDISDTELEASLQLSWERDRSKKKIKKKEREELRAQGLLGNNGQADLKVKYREGISFGEIRDELIDFMISARQSLAFPPMANHERRMVHEMAHVLRLKSDSRGQGKARFPVLYKSSRTGDFDEASIEQLQSLSTSKRFLPRKDVKGQRRAAGLRPGRRDAANTAGVSYQDGEVVGAAAPEIGEENRGRAMLEKMGWSRGMGLGALNNKGMLHPVVHTVKTSKAGLG
ncbi:MAG: hypothetical protein Q9184_000986 [Pyrenodesmia sp. 2 TL-2023]